jgi:hypothetical protein
MAQVRSQESLQTHGVLQFVGVRFSGGSAVDGAKDGIKVDQ